MSDFIQAPWTPEQVMRAERWQRCNSFPPYTCGNRNYSHPHEPDYGDHGVLRPTVNGWICAYCDYTQDWAHDFTLEEEPPKSIFEYFQDQRQRQYADCVDCGPDSHTKLKGCVFYE